MAIEVYTVDGTTHTFEDATTWHVDDVHGLHLRSGEKQPVASFAVTKWIGVRRHSDR